MGSGNAVWKIEVFDRETVCPLCERPAVQHEIAVTRTDTGLQLAALCPYQEGEERAPERAPLAPIDPVLYLDARTFREDGYLQEANRQFFHPLGLALEVRTDGSRPALLRVWDYRDNPEGIEFDGDEIDLMLRAQRLGEISALRHTARVNALGYWIQPADGNPRK